MLQRMSVRSTVVGAIALVVLATMLAAAAFAQGTQERLGGKLRAGDQVVVAADETVRGDLIASAGEVRVDGVVDGDLVVVGGQIDVNGQVTGDLLAAGGAVFVGGVVDGDVRATAGQTEIAGEVGEDVVVGAGEVRLTPASAVAGDVMLWTGQARLDGPVAGSVVGAAGDYRATGSVGGVEDVRIGEPATAPTVAERGLSAAGSFIGLLLVGGLLIAVAPIVVRDSEARLRQRPWASLGVGAGGLVGGGVAAVVVMVVAVVLAVLFGIANIGTLAAASVLGGLLLAALIGFGLFVGVAFLAHLVVGLWLGRLVLGDAAEVSRWHLFGALALGVLVVSLLRAVPFLGPLVTLAVVLVGLGAALGWAWQWWRRSGAVVPPPPPAPQPAAVSSGA